MEFLFREQHRLIKNLKTTRRYLFEKIDWSLRCIGIFGSRGTGKTTLMLQYVKEYFEHSDKALYISVDNPYFQSLSLFEFAENFHNVGGEVLLLDEVHKYSNWASFVKSIYDSFPELKIIFSGSSLLKIAKQDGDLSRRAIVYHLHGLSFREYLNFTQNFHYKPSTLKNILNNHIRIASEISNDLRVLKHFKEYLRNGYYPFCLEGVNFYRMRVSEVMNIILEADLPYVSNIEPRQISKIKKLIYLLAVSVPFMPNITKLSEATEISRPKLYEYLELLQEAKILNIIRAMGRGYKILTKPEKIYLENPNLMYAVSDFDKVNIGSVREVFFVNQLKNHFSMHPRQFEPHIELSSAGDFLVYSEYTFEVGGKNKDFKQIKNVKKSYLALDDIEIGLKKRIPLWLFGFLY